MALKKPSEYFKPKEKTVIDESVQELIKTPELSTFSDAFESFKRNLNKIEMLSEFSETLDNYRVNVERVNHLSEKVEDIQTEIQNLLKKEDLDRAMMSQLLVVEKSIHDLQTRVKGINEKTLTEIRLDVSGLTQNVNKFLEIDVPKYKKLVVDSELRTTNRYEELEQNVNQTLEGIGEFVENKYHQLTETLQGINEQSLRGILEDFKTLNKTVLKFKEEEIPKYKGLVIETERKTEYKIDEFQKTLDETIADVLSKVNSIEGDKTDLVSAVNNKIKDISILSENITKQFRLVEKTSEDHKDKINQKVAELEVEIIRNESHIKNQNKHIDKIQEDVRSAIDRLNLEELEEKNYELTKKIKYLEEIFDKFNSETLTEGLLNEPPSVKNEDPLTPLDSNFVTLDQLQEHYRLFINRIQQQLSTLTGGGETRLKYLDDVVGIATNASVYDGKFLRYTHSSGKFEFSSVPEPQALEIVSDNQDTTRYLVLSNVSVTTGISTVLVDDSIVYNPGTNSLGINTSNPTSKLTVVGDAYFTGIVTATDYNSASDAKLKENISVIDNPIDKIIKLEGVNFQWKETGKKSLGVIAQEVEKVLPELVSGEDSKTVNYNGIIGLLIECVKHQQKEIEDLKRRLDK